MQVFILFQFFSDRTPPKCKCLYCFSFSVTGPLWQVFILFQFFSDRTPPKCKCLYCFSFSVTGSLLNASVYTVSVFQLIDLN